MIFSPYKVLTTGDIARYCQVTHFTVANWINAGKLRAYKTPGRHHRVRQEDFLTFLETYQFPIPEELVTPSSSIPRPSVEEQETSGLERRKSRRFTAAFPIYYSLHIPRQTEGEQLTGKGKTIDICREGLMLETALPLRPNNLLDLAIMLRQGAQPIQAEGMVQWVQPGNSLVQKVGIQFARIAEEDRLHLVDTLFATRYRA